MNHLESNALNTYPYAVAARTALQECVSKHPLTGDQNLSILYHIAMMTVSPGPIVLSKTPRKNLVTNKVSALKHVAVNMSTTPHRTLRWFSDCGEAK